MAYRFTMFAHIIQHYRLCLQKNASYRGLLLFYPHYPALQTMPTEKCMHRIVVYYCFTHIIQHFTDSAYRKMHASYRGLLLFCPHYPALQTMPTGKMHASYRGLLLFYPHYPAFYRLCLQKNASYRGLLLFYPHYPAFYRLCLQEKCMHHIVVYYCFTHIIQHFTDSAYRKMHRIVVYYCFTRIIQHFTDSAYRKMHRIVVYYCFTHIIQHCRLCLQGKCMHRIVVYYCFTHIIQHFADSAYRKMHASYRGLLLFYPHYPAFYRLCLQNHVSTGSHHTLPQAPGGALTHQPGEVPPPATGYSHTSRLGTWVNRWPPQKNAQNIPILMMNHADDPDSPSDFASKTGLYSPGSPWFTWTVPLPTMNAGDSCWGQWTALVFFCNNDWGLRCCAWKKIDEGISAIHHATYKEYQLLNCPLCSCPAGTLKNWANVSGKCYRNP